MVIEQTSMMETIKTSENVCFYVYIYIQGVPQKSTNRDFPKKWLFTFKNLPLKQIQLYRFTVFNSRI